MAIRSPMLSLTGFDWEDLDAQGLRIFVFWAFRISQMPSACLTSSQEKIPVRGCRGVPSGSRSPDIPQVT
jgi:hypothetical protein